MKLSKYIKVLSDESNYKIVDHRNGNIITISNKKLKDFIDGLSMGNHKMDLDSTIKSYIDELISLGILVKNDENPIKESDSILTVTLFVTKQCNLRCEYCYEKFENQFMSEKEFNAIIAFLEKQITNKKFKVVRINLFGGEPLLCKERILNFLEKLDPILKKKKIDLSIGITTNGIFLDEIIISKLMKFGLKDIQVTVDCLEYIHNKRKKLVNGDSAWKLVINNLMKISSYSQNISIVIRTNLYKDEIDEYEKFLLWALENLGDKFYYHFAFVQNWGMNNSDDVVDKGMEFEEILKILKIYKRLKVKSVYSKIIMPGFLKCSHCDENSYVFDTDLTWRKCTVYLEHSKNKLGELTTNGNLMSNGNVLYWKKEETCDDCRLNVQCLNRRCLMKRNLEEGFVCDRIAEIRKYDAILRELYL